MFKFIVIGLSFLLSFSLLAQDRTQKMVKYTPEFKFEDGFYLSFSMVKNNSPIPEARVITNIDKSSNDFYSKLLESKSFSFFDGNGVKQSVSSRIWGFSRNGVLYIKMSEGFHRITIVGGICHFVASIVSYDTRYNNPYYNRSPYSSRYYDPYSNNQSRTTRNQEMKQYVMDFKTGKTYEYDVKSVEVLLMEDPELYDEYMGLKNKKKKQLKFYYIRKFNEGNPIYIPMKNKF